MPHEIQERRKRLMPLFKKANEDRSKKVSWALDKLVIDGRFHSATDAPLNIDLEHAGIDTDILHGERVNEGGSTFQAHCADV